MINLDIKSEYTEIYGIISIKNIVTKAKELGQPAVALTDMYHLSGMYEFYEECKKQQIKPIIGIEILLDLKELNELPRPIKLYAKNNNGIKNLIQITTQGYLNQIEDKVIKSVTTLDILAQYKEDLICIGGSEFSHLTHYLTAVGALNSNIKKANEYIENLTNIFNTDFYVEINLPNNLSQKLLGKHKLNLNSQFVFVNPILFLTSAHKQLHDERLCIALNHKMYLPPRWGYSLESSTMPFRLSAPNNYHFFSENEVDRILNQNFFPYSLIENTYEIANKIDSNSYFNDIYNKYTTYQDINIPSYEALENLTYYYLQKKFPNQIPENYKARLNDELKLIKQMGFSDYMLIVWDYVEGITSTGVIVGPGRGSAGCSLVSHLLGITLLDPIEFDLPMARFLNKGRGAIPKIF